MRLATVISLLLCLPARLLHQHGPARQASLSADRRDFSDRVKVVTIPLPVIASSPNEGVTDGALSAFLLHNDRDEVTSLLAPQINYNKNFGATFSFTARFTRHHSRVGNSTFPVRPR